MLVTRSGAGRYGGPRHEPLQNEVTHLQAHIKTLRLGTGALLVVALVMGGGWWSAPRDLTIHVPPDLRSGSTRKWWEVPPGRFPVHVLRLSAAQSLASRQ